VFDAIPEHGYWRKLQVMAWLHEHRAAAIRWLRSHTPTCPERAESLPRRRGGPAPGRAEDLRE
jgi:hypothetical protein